MSKVFLYGNRGVGKSFCIQKIVKECQLPVCGFLTLPFYEHDKRIGFYMHSIIDCINNDQIFSIDHETWNETIPNVFNTFGVAVLKARQAYEKHVMILDEIGYLERNEHRFIEELRHSISTHENIFGVLKKCDIQYIQEIKKRNDIILLNFDEMSQSEIMESLYKIWRNYE